MSSQTSFAQCESLFAGVCETADVAERAEPPASSRVLVVEDDPVIAHLIKHLLTRKGFTVDVATDGQQAQTMVDTLAPPCVLVLDVMLPFVGGFELVERVRNRQEWAKVPILMLTSKSHESYVVRAFGAGVDDYVTKPFRPEELVARVRRLAGA
jgi:two-component system alkaline phosphatase synthesis response regulator PhoP